ncbi:HalOD1 output domain-containing protein [Halorubellus sp. PRR65]|uniref:HalOD1 output domain-containing protein n=1 Tax=Halorubellus sp. PRR65 TaxID=3098148 RepID=UPI002B25A434|nr:HalOD1 output domain-containing protein [Halorubellus sp. PRR65]
MTDTDEIHHRELDPDGEAPATQVASTVASLSERDQEGLQSAWERFDHVVDEIFENPPAPEAQVEVRFTYEGYRITVEQDGHARFVPIDPDAE